jgi:hypothetical protein
LFGDDGGVTGVGAAATGAGVVTGVGAVMGEEAGAEAGAEEGAEAGATVVGVVPPVQVRVPQMSEFRQFTAAIWASWQLAQSGHASAKPHCKFCSAPQVTEPGSPPGKYP